MLLRAPVFCALALGLVACERPEPPAAPTQPDSAAAPAPDQPFFVGRWAFTESDCAVNAWTFTPNSLQARAGTCSFPLVEPTPEGFAIDAACRWAGEVSRARMRLAYAQSAKALLVSGSPAGDVGLVACPAR